MDKLQTTEVDQNNASVTVQLLILSKEPDLAMEVVVNNQAILPHLHFDSMAALQRLDVELVAVLRKACRKAYQDGYQQAQTNIQRAMGIGD